MVFKKKICANRASSSLGQFGLEGHRARGLLPVHVRGKGQQRLARFGAALHLKRPAAPRLPPPSSRWRGYSISRPSPARGAHNVPDSVRASAGSTTSAIPELLALPIMPQPVTSSFQVVSVVRIVDPGVQLIFLVLRI